MSEKISVVYHGNCADGFGAAWVFHNVQQYVIDRFDFHAGVYGKAPPDNLSRCVVLVDFSYKRAVIEQLLADGHSITMLDHHKTAIEDLATLKHPKFLNLNELNHSGAMLAWLYWHGRHSIPPDGIKYIEDRDLWRFHYAETRAYNAALFSHEYDFAVWDKLMLDTPTATMVAEGEAISRKHLKDVRELIAATKRYVNMAGHRVPVANMPYFHASEAGMQMCEGELFAATYFVNKDGEYNFSLRSSAVGVDVAEIASTYGGGGHRTASGFRISARRAREEFGL